MKAVNFLKEVKQEAVKIKWPAAREVLIIAFFVVLVTGVFGAIFLLIDSAIYRMIKMFLGIGA